MEGPFTQMKSLVARSLMYILFRTEDKFTCQNSLVRKRSFLTTGAFSMAYKATCCRKFPSRTILPRRSHQHGSFRTLPCRSIFVKCKKMMPNMILERFSDFVLSDCDATFVIRHVSCVSYNNFPNNHRKQFVWQRKNQDLRAIGRFDISSYMCEKQTNQSSCMSKDCFFKKTPLFTDPTLCTSLSCER